MAEVRFPLGPDQARAIPERAALTTISRTKESLIVTLNTPRGVLTIYLTPDEYETLEASAHILDLHPGIKQIVSPDPT